VVGEKKRFWKNLFFWRQIRIFLKNTPKKMLSKCLEYLKREEFKSEVKQLLNPLLEIVVEALRPYLIYALAIVLIFFGILLIILYYVTKRPVTLGLTLV
jgi:hypothetical protein